MLANIIFSEDARGSR